MAIFYSNNIHSGDMKDDIEKQLHEQYAINNNAKSGILLTLLSTLMVSFTGFGYVQVIFIKGDLKGCFLSCLSGIAVEIVLLILYYACIHLGYTQRSDQFVIYSIRKKAYENEEELEKVFGKGYSPFNKGWINFIQGLYNGLSSIILSITLLLPFAFICNGKKYVLAFFLISCFAVLLMLLYKFRKYQSYKSKEKEMCNKEKTCRVCEKLESILIALAILVLAITLLIGTCKAFKLFQSEDIMYFSTDESSCVIINKNVSLPEKRLPASKSKPCSPDSSKCCHRAHH